MKRGILLAAIVLASLAAVAAPPKKEKPKTIPEQVQELRDEVTQLRQEIQALRIELAAMKTAKAGDPASKNTGGVIAVGMTLAEVQSLVGQPGQLREEDEFGKT